MKKIFKAFEVSFAVLGLMFVGAGANAQTAPANDSLSHQISPAFRDCALPYGGQKYSSRGGDAPSCGLSCNRISGASRICNPGVFVPWPTR